MTCRLCCKNGDDNSSSYCTRNLTQSIINCVKITPTLQIDNLNNQEKSMTFLDYFYKHRKILAVLFEYPGFKRKFHRMLKDMIVIKREKECMDPAEITISMDILASSVLGIIMWWLKDGIHFSSEYIANQMIALYR